jgi:prolyl-tRNA synthetase
MRISNYFLPLLSQEPREATIKSHSLMLRSGMIRQLCSGLYAWLPLGLKVLKKVEEIIRKELDDASCVEMLMPCLQPASLWHQSQRYETYGKEMLRMQDRHQQELIFGPTAEELTTDIFRNNIRSYQELPKIFYQIQWKFRDEIRPRFGLMRAREFLLQDAYSFDVDVQSSEKSYWKMYATYLRIFHKLGLKVLPLEADSGAIGGDFSHEFHVLADIGESTLHFDEALMDLLSMESTNENFLTDIAKLYAATDEKHNPQDKRISGQLKQSKGIEVGHTFLLSNKYSTPMNAKVQNKNGNLIPVEMGCYGIGVSRVVAAMIETHHDDTGILWPTNDLAPFKIGISNLDTTNEDCVRLADEVYEITSKICKDTLYDDSKNSPGQKFALQDLIGVPIQIRVGRKLIASQSLEIKLRRNGTIETIEKENLVKYLAANNII